MIFSNEYEPTKYGDERTNNYTELDHDDTDDDDLGEFIQHIVSLEKKFGIDDKYAKRICKRRKYTAGTCSSNKKRKRCRCKDTATDRKPQMSPSNFFSMSACVDSRKNDVNSFCSSGTQKETVKVMDDFINIILPSYQRKVEIPGKVTTPYPLKLQDYQNQYTSSSVMYNIQWLDLDCAMSQSLTSCETLMQCPNSRLRNTINQSNYSRKKLRAIVARMKPGYARAA